MAGSADRGPFVRLPVASGKFGAGDAVAFADALDAASKDPATKADLSEVRTEVALVRSEISQIRSDMAQLRSEMIQRIEAGNDRLMVRLGGLMIALTGALFAALRLTQP